MKRLRVGLLVGCLSWGGACGPSDDRGPVHHVYLDDAPQPNAGAGGETGAAGAAGEAAGAPPVEPLLAPAVTAMMPTSGAYGSELRIEGEGLGSAARPGVRLRLGADGAGELTPTSKPQVVSWSEGEIRFRFPFPFEGRVVVETPQGEAEAGEFEPTWAPGPPLDSVVNVASTAALASAPGVLAAVLNTGPPSLVVFDGAGWSSTAIPGKNLRADSIRLYLDGNALASFGLSTATAPEIVQLEPGSDFAQTPSGVKVTADYRLAGGVDGAAVWSRTGNNWTRARPTSGVWAVDKGPIADPNPAGASHVAGALSDGTFFVGWGEDTGSALDDRGAAFHRRLLDSASAFEAKVRTGGEVDDAVSTITMTDRGGGLIVRYCGTDKDPFGATGNETLCYAALLPTGSKMTTNESAALRYAFGGEARVAAYCSPSQGLRLVPELGAGGTTPAKFDALAGDVVAWPCPKLLALEVDPDGQPLIMLEQDGQLYSPRPRVR